MTEIDKPLPAGPAAPPAALLYKTQLEINNQSSRNKAVGWSVAVAVVALTCYLLSIPAARAGLGAAFTNTLSGLHLWTRVYPVLPVATLLAAFIGLIQLCSRLNFAGAVATLPVSAESRPHYQRAIERLSGPAILFAPNWACFGTVLQVLGCVYLPSPEHSVISPYASFFFALAGFVMSFGPAYLLFLGPNPRWLSNPPEFVNGAAPGMFVCTIVRRRLEDRLTDA